MIIGYKHPHITQVEKIIVIVFLLGGSSKALSTQLPQRPSLRVVPLVSDKPCDKERKVTPQLLSVHVNALNTNNEYLFLLRDCGSVLAAVDDLEEMRIITDGRPTVEYDGRRYVLLNSFPGLTFRLSERAQKIFLEGEPYIFRRTVIDLDRAPVRAPDPVANGAFLGYNYSFGGTRNSRISFTQNYDLGFFGPWGTIANRFVIVDPSIKSAFGRRLVRSNTTYEYQFINKNSTLRIGDIFGFGGSWGSSPAMLGIQYGSNFTLHPNRGVLPVTNFDFDLRRRASIGVNSYPLWIDSPQRRYYEQMLTQQQVNIRAFTLSALHGPVSLINVPNTIENRSLLLMTTDIERSFFYSQKPDYYGRRLLREGISDFSYELGLARNDPISDRYSGFAASATHRYGLSNFFTIEGHGEIQQERAAIGGNIGWAVPYIGSVSGTIAYSTLKSGVDGFMDSIAVENTIGRLGYQLFYTRTDASYRPSVTGIPNKIALGGGLSFPLLGGQLSLGRSKQVFHQAANGINQQYSESIGYNLPLPLGMQLFLLGTQSKRERKDYSLNAILNIPLLIFGDGRNGNVQIDYGKNKDQEYRSRIRGNYNFSTNNQPISISASQGISNPEESSLGANWVGSKFAINSEINRIGNLYAHATTISGGIVAMAKKLFFTQSVGNSFALLRLGKDYENVRVNSSVADSDGDILIPNLTAYHQNILPLDLRDYALGMQPENTFFDVVTQHRAGTIFKPSIKARRDALITVKVKKGNNELAFLPLGAYGKIEGNDENFPVGDEGLIYVYGVFDKFDINLRYRGEKCSLSIELPPLSKKDQFDDTPEIGPLICQGISL
jgi:outer membrane usher protein